MQYFVRKVCTLSGFPYGTEVQCVVSNQKLCSSAKTSKDGERFDRAQWKSMQQTMNDSTKFVDMLHNVSWEDGLPTEVMQGN